MSEKQDKELGEVAQRLTLLRERLGPPLGLTNKRAFAEHVGFSPQRWGNFENGFPLSHDAAMQLVRKFPGLTLDWLQRGEEGGLSMQIGRQLERKETTIPGSSGRSTS